MPGQLNVTFADPGSTPPRLGEEGFSLYGYKAVQTRTNGGAPMVWFRDLTFLANGRTLTWTETYRAYCELVRAGAEFNRIVPIEKEPRVRLDVHTHTLPSELPPRREPLRICRREHAPYIFLELVYAVLTAVALALLLLWFFDERPVYNVDVSSATDFHACAPPAIPSRCAARNAAAGDAPPARWRWNDPNSTRA
jgi:hypothetical protein